jgi:hypothetical protein
MTVVLSEAATDQTTTLTVCGTELGVDALPELSGIKGTLKRANLAKQNLDETRQTPGGALIIPFAMFVVCSGVKPYPANTLHFEVSFCSLA